MSKKKIKNHKEKNQIQLGVPNIDTTLSVEDLTDGYFYKIDVVWTSSRDVSHTRIFMHECYKPKYLVNQLIYIWNKVKDRHGSTRINIYRNKIKMWDDSPNSMMGAVHVYNGPFTQEVFETICEAWKEYIEEEE